MANMQFKWYETAGTVTYNLTTTARYDDEIEETFVEEKQQHITFEKNLTDTIKTYYRKIEDNNAVGSYSFTQLPCSKDQRKYVITFTSSLPLTVDCTSTSSTISYNVKTYFVNDETGEETYVSSLDVSTSITATYTQNIDSESPRTITGTVTYETASAAYQITQYGVTFSVVPTKITGKCYVDDSSINFTYSKVVVSALNPGTTVSTEDGIDGVIKVTRTTPGTFSGTYDTSWHGIKIPYEITVSDHVYSYQISPTLVTNTCEWDATSCELTYNLIKYKDDVIETTTEKKFTVSSLSPNNTGEYSYVTGTTSDTTSSIEFKYQIRQKPNPAKVVYTYSVESDDLYFITDGKATEYTVFTSGYTYLDGYLIDNGVEKITYTVTLHNDTSKAVSYTTGSFDWHGITIKYSVGQVNDETYVGYMEYDPDDVGILNEYVEYYIDDVPDVIHMSKSIQTFFKGEYIGEKIYEVDITKSDLSSTIATAESKGYGEYLKDWNIWGSCWINFYVRILRNDITIDYYDKYSNPTCYCYESSVFLRGMIYVRKANGDLLYCYDSGPIYKNIGINNSEDTRIIEGVLVKTNLTTLNYKITQYGTSTSCCAIRPICVSTSLRMWNDYKDTEDYYKFYHTGNAVYFNRVIKHNMDNELQINCTNTDFIKSFNVENYGFCLTRNAGYGYWPGGSSGANNEATVTCTIGTSVFTQDIISELDEDNCEFLSNGLFTNKVIRVPAQGNSYNFDIGLYPLSFYSDYFYTDYGDKIIFYGYYQPNKGAVINSGITLNNFLVQSIGASDMVQSYGCTQTASALDYILSLSIAPNTLDTYREFYIQSEYISIHFLQEYASDRRVYYGQIDFTEPKIDDIYYKTQADSAKYNYYFQLTNSVIVDKSLTLTSSDENSKNKVICIPKAIYSNYEITNGKVEQISDSYNWGSQTYVIFKYYGTNGSFKFNFK